MDPKPVSPEAVSVGERTAIADSLQALTFSMRPQGAAGNAWALDVMTRGLARAILAVSGPLDKATALNLTGIAQKTLQQIVQQALTEAERANLRNTILGRPQ